MNNVGAVDRLFGLQLLGATVDAIPQAVCVIDETRGVAFVNGAMSRLTGRNAKELLGQSAQEFAQILSRATEDSEEGLLGCGKLLLGNGSEELDIRFGDGSWRNMACHGGDDGGRILIVSDIGSDQVGVEIKDNGPGIPEAIRSRIFEPFFTTKKQGEGTGIGLALCHRVIEAHGGEIEVISAPGQGAAFVIRLPGHEEAGASDGQ